MQMISSYGYSNQNNPNSKNKKILNLVIICIVIVLLISACLIGAIYYLNVMQQKALKVYVDEKKVSFNEDTFIINNGKVYVAIKDIASALGYDTHNGEYKVYSEDLTKCYVENSNETASFFLNSNKVSKVAPNSSDEYIDYIISEPVKKENDKLYVISEGIQIGYNVKFSYDIKTNTIKIYTLPYLVSYYNTKITKYGYKGISSNFDNQKAILYDMFVVQNANEKYGVIDINNKEIISCRYDNMNFNEGSKEFFVTNALSKVGIIMSNGTNKINIEYDEIKVLDKEKELYLVKNNNKYGIIDKDGKIKINVGYESIKVLNNELGLYVVKYNGKYGLVDEKDKQIIYWEYDSIGLSNIESYTTETIDNPYLLFENLIPVKKNNKWGLFDINGKQILNCEYDSFGCIASTVINDKVVNNTLFVPDCECIVVCKDNKYGLVNKKGEIIIQVVLNAVYSTTSLGVNTYYMNLDNNGTTVDYEILSYLEHFGLYTPKKDADNDTTSTEKDDSNSKNEQATNTNENQIENNVIQNNTVENSVEQQNNLDVEQDEFEETEN